MAYSTKSESTQKNFFWGFHQIVIFGPYNDDWSQNFIFFVVFKTIFWFFEKNTQFAHVKSRVMAENQSLTSDACQFVNFEATRSYYIILETS